MHIALFAAGEKERGFLFLDAFRGAAEFCKSERPCSLLLRFFMLLRSRPSLLTGKASCGQAAGDSGAAPDTVAGAAGKDLSTHAWGSLQNSAGDPSIAWHRQAGSLYAVQGRAGDNLAAQEAGNGDFSYLWIA